MAVDAGREATTGSFVAARAPRVEVVEVGHEAVLVDEELGGLHVLNATAALLWQCFDGESTLEDICADLADEMHAPRDVVLADTSTVVDDLVRQGLVYDAAGPPPERDRCGPRAHADVAPRPDRLLEEPPNF